MKILSVIFLIICVAQKLDASALGSTRIVGGSRDDYTTFHVQVVYLNAQNAGLQGGGALISTRHVLTLASNIQGWVSWNLGFGSSQYSAMTFIQSNSAVIHPNYSPGTLFNRNDIGMIFLPVPITLTQNIQVIPMPPIWMVDVYVGETVGIRGFGRTSPNSGRPDFLQRAFQTAVDINVCTTAFGLGTDAQNFICASGTTTSICVEDAGGAVTNDLELTYLVGLAPSNVNGCQVNTATPYVRVTQYRDWIDSIIF